MENIRLPRSIKPRPYWVQYLSTYIIFLKILMDIFFIKLGKKVRSLHGWSKQSTLDL